MSCKARIGSAIKVRELKKTYNGIHAVDGISFDVPYGATCALLGGNGAGKTTTLSILLGLVVPTSGSIEVLNEDMLRHRYRVLGRVNFSSPYVDLPQRLTVRENLTVYARLYGVRKISSRLATLSEELDLGEFMKRRLGTLSAGQKTRVAIAKALLNQPEILFLDEPTASLDPDSADRIRAYLQDYKASSGATLLFASHNMSEVERLCSDVIMLRKGKIAARGSPGELARRYGSHSMEDVFLAITRQESSSVAQTIP